MGVKARKMDAESFQGEIIRWATKKSVNKVLTLKGTFIFLAFKKGIF